jgi:hypothetical protein
VVLVLGPFSPASAAGDDPAAVPGLDAVRRLVDAGAKPRVAASVVAELTGGSANELYRALTAADGGPAADGPGDQPAADGPGDRPAADRRGGD